MLYSIILGLAMFGLWILLSGIYVPLILSYGIVSCVLTVMIAKRMYLVDAEAVFLTLRFRALTYPGWITREIAKANWAIAKVILSPRLELQQQFIEVQTSQKTDLGRVLFANSITLTPGTITVETESSHFLVHAVVDDAANHEALAEMDARIRALEAVD